MSFLPIELLRVLENVCWGSRPTSTDPMRFLATVGWRRKALVVTVALRGEEDL